MTAMFKNLIILLVLIALGAFGYFMFFNSSDNSIVSTSGNGNVNSQAAFQTREFKAILNDLNTIDLDSPLLQDSKFLQLNDHSQPVSERPYGRQNPFLFNQ